MIAAAVAVRIRPCYHRSDREEAFSRTQGALEALLLLYENIIISHTFLTFSDEPTWGTSKKKTSNIKMYARGSSFMILKMFKKKRREKESNLDRAGYEKGEGVLERLLLSEQGHNF